MRHDPEKLDALVKSATDWTAGPQELIALVVELAAIVKTQGAALDRLWPDWQTQTTAPSCLEGN